MIVVWCIILSVGFPQQDICCVRGAAGGRVLSTEERRQSGRKGHAHHCQALPHVASPPLGAQRWGPLHRRERQTRARYTEVTTASLLRHSVTLHHVTLHTHHVWHEHRNRLLVVVPSLPTLCVHALAFFYLFFLLYTSYSFSLTLSLPILSCLVLLLCVPCNVSRDGAAGITDDGNRK